MDSFTELTKKMKILNTPLEIDRKRDIVVLNTTELLDNEKIDRHVSNTICQKKKNMDILKNNVIDIIKM